MVAIMVIGLASYTTLPVSALPEADYPTIQVQTFYPGASPQVMSSGVTAPLERQFGQVAGLTQMTSTSSDGSSVIVLQFLLNLNIDIAEQEVQAAINQAQTYLPTDLPTPPAALQQDQPGGCADSDDRPHVGQHFALAGRGPGRHPPGTEDLPGCRGW